MDSTRFQESPRSEEDTHPRPPAPEPDAEAEDAESFPRPDPPPAERPTSYLALPPDLHRRWSHGLRWYERLVVRVLLAVVGIAALAAAWWLLVRGG